MPATPVATFSGFFGKIPSHGDFIKYNLPRGFIDPWDDWVQTSMSRMQQNLGNDWLDLYLTSPIYRFALTPGICGEESRIGLIIPSVDRVGRYYPLTLSAPIGENTNPFCNFTEQEAWFQFAEELALSTLEDGISFSELAEQTLLLDEKLLSADELSLPEFESCEKLPDALLIRKSLASIGDASTLYPALLDTVLKEACHAYSLWWTSGSEAIDGSFLVSQGLPVSSNMAAFLDGRWSQWGWLSDNPQRQPLLSDYMDDPEPWDN